MESLGLLASLRRLHLLLEARLLLFAESLGLTKLAPLNLQQLHAAFGDDHPHTGLDLCDAPQVAVVALAGEVATAAALEVEDPFSHEAKVACQFARPPGGLEPHEASPHLREGREGGR